MSNKIEKKSPGTGLVKSSGAPNLQAMKKQRGDSTPATDKLKLRARQNEPVSVSGVSLQVLIIFDITGSMFKYFETVRQKLQEIVAAVKKESPGAQFAIYAYRNHGDEDKFAQIYYTSPLTANLEEIQGFIAKIEKGGGGPDALTCMEECLHDANSLPWDLTVPKALVVIGDMPPHGVLDPISGCYKGIDYRLEVSSLKQKGVKIYSVFCPTHKNDRVYRFFQALAEDGNGKFMEISEIEILVELLIGICLKETGNFDKFVERLGFNKSLSDPQKKRLLMLKE
jgi:hypothetical protein